MDSKHVNPVKMDSKRRILGCFNFEKIDRIGRFDQFWSETAEIYRAGLGLPGSTELEEYFDIDLYKPGVNEAPFPSMVQVISEDEKGVIRRNGYGMVERVRKDGYFTEELEPFVKDYSDVDKLLFESPRDEKRYVTVVKTIGEKPGRCVFAKIGGPFLRTEFLRGKTRYLMDIAEDPELVMEMAGRMNDFLLSLGSEAVKRGGLYDTGIWIFDDMAYNAGPLISPKAFEKIFLPLYKKLVGGLKEAGARYVLFHSDGNIEPLLDMLVEAGIDGINPVEPRSGMSIEALKKKYGEKLRYIGGMCNSDVLVNGPKERIVDQARNIIELAKDGGVVIGTHSVGVDIRFGTIWPIMRLCSNTVRCSAMLQCVWHGT